MKPFWIVSAFAVVASISPGAVHAQIQTGKVRTAIDGAVFVRETLDKALGDLRNANSLAAYARIDLKLVGVVAIDEKNRTAWAMRGEVMRRALRYRNSVLAEDKERQAVSSSPDSVLHAYDKALALDSNTDSLSNQIAYGRGWIFLDYKNEAERALEEFNKVIAANPQFGPAYLGRALASGRLPQPDHQAIFEDYNKAIALGFKVADLALPEDKTYDDFFAAQALSTAHHGRGLLFILRNENEKALSDLSAAIESNLMNVDAIVDRGRLHATINQPERAINDFSAALLWRPNDAAVYRLRATQYEKIGQQERAATDVERATQIASGKSFAPTAPVPAPVAATPPANFSTEAPPPAIIPDAEAQAIVATAGEALQRGNAAMTQGKPEDALREFSKAIELDPKNAVALASRGWALARMREYVRAAADFDAALKLLPDDVGLLLARGQMNGRAGRSDAAIADLQRATQLAPNNIAAWEQLGVAQQASGKYADAEVNFQKANELLVQNANAAGQETTLAALRLAIVRAAQNKTEGFEAALAGANASQLRGALGILEFELKKQPENAALQTLREKMTAELGKLQ